MATENIASSPIVNPGKGCNAYRVVLRVDLDNNGNPREYYTHKQYLVLDGKQGDYFSYSYGDYFVVRGKESKEVLVNAYKNFCKRSEETVREHPLADQEIFKRFVLLEQREFEKSHK